MASTTIIIKEKGKLSSAITRFAKSLDKQDELSHQLAVSALYHYKEHGDTQYMTALAKGTAKYRAEEGKAIWDGRSLRAADLRKWIEDFAGVKWSTAANKDTGGYRASKSIKAVKRSDINLDKAIATPYYKYSADTNVEPKVYDAAKEATALRDRIRKLLEEGESKSGKQVLPEDAMHQRAIASALVNSLSEFLKTHGEHSAPEAKGQSPDVIDEQLIDPTSVAADLKAAS